jgi:hypothetical protein
VEGGSHFVQSLVNGNVIAVIATIQSGDVFNIGSNQILNGDSSTPASLQRPLFIGRNTLRGPGTAEFNVRYTRLIPLAEGLRLEFIAESTNVFNRTNVVAVDSIATVTATGSILVPPSQRWTGALDQRLLQLGVRLAF